MVPVQVEPKTLITLTTPTTVRLTLVVRIDARTLLEETGWNLEFVVKKMKKKPRPEHLLQNLL